MKNKYFASILSLINNSKFFLKAIKNNVESSILIKFGRQFVKPVEPLKS